MANKETTYKPEPKYLFGGRLKERREGRKEARGDYREEKKKQRQEARAAKKEARVSKRTDIKAMRTAKKDQIAEIKGSDMTRSEKRLAIKEIRGDFRKDKKARKQRKKTEIKGIKAARKLDKQYAKEDKLRAIAENTGKFSIRGKIAEARADRIDRRASGGKGRYGRWQDKAPETYYDEKHRAEDQDDSYVKRYGGYGEMATEEREQWKEDQAAAKEEERRAEIAENVELNEEGQPQSDVELDDEVPSSEFVSGLATPPGRERTPEDIGPSREDGTFKDGGFTIKYNEGGLTVKLLKGLKKLTKNENKKKLIQARIEKKEGKAEIKDLLSSGDITEEQADRYKKSLQETQDVEKAEIKKDIKDSRHVNKLKRIAKRKERRDKRDDKKPSGTPMFAQGGMNNKGGGLDASVEETRKKRQQESKKSKYNIGKKGMKVNEMGHGVLILLGKKSDKK